MGTTRISNAQIIYLNVFKHCMKCQMMDIIYFSIPTTTLNKANLRDLIAATGLVILLKLDSNHRFFSHMTLKFDWWPQKNYRAPLLHYIKLCASSQTPRWIRTTVAVRKRSIPVTIGYFLPRVTLKFNGWPWKTIGIVFYITLSFVHNLKAIGELKLKLRSGNAQLGPKLAIFCPVWP